MYDLVMSPIFWIGVVLVIVALIVLSALISKQRNKEVDELGTYFPEEELLDSNRISVEKVRRSTLARQKRKQASKHLPRRQPREDVLDLDKQEFVELEKEDELPKQNWNESDQEDEFLDQNWNESDQEEENENLPAVQESFSTERQFNRRQFKSSVLQSRNTEATEESQTTNTRRPPFTRRPPLSSNTNPTTNSPSRSPLRRPVGNKTAYPSLRRDANKSTTSEESTAPRFPNRRSKRMF